MDQQSGHLGLILGYARPVLHHISNLLNLIYCYDIQTEHACLATAWQNDWKTIDFSIDLNLQSCITPV